MTVKEISKALGFKRAEDLYKKYGYNRHQVAKIKKRNIERYKMILVDMIVKELLFKGGAVEYNNLISVLKFHNKQLEALKDDISKGLDGESNE